MTEAEAENTLDKGRRHIGGDIGIRMFPYDCPGGFAVVFPVVGHPGLSYVFTNYDENIQEGLGAAAAAPPIKRINWDGNMFRE